MPERFQLRRSRGWRMPANGVKCDRTTSWGNPWRIEEHRVPLDGEHHWSVRHAAGTARAFFVAKEPAARYSVGRFRSSLLHPLHPGLTFDCLTVRRELAGFDLGCWCGLDEWCHVDVLLEAANR